MRRSKGIAYGVSVSAFILTASTAFAQTSSGTEDSSETGGLQEIIVTAQKRAENVQDVPIAVNAIQGEALAKSGVTGLEDLKQLSPSFNFRPSSANNIASIRGVSGDFSGPSSESPIAINFDDVYIGTDSGYFYPFVAVERVDVLAGPQGTLFGRNATGGVVNIILKEPSHTSSGQFSVGYGNYDTFTADTYATTGLSETVAIDFAGSIRLQRDGYGTNLFDGKDVGKYDSKTVRGSILWEPSAATKVRFSADYNQYDGSTFGSHALYGQANDTVVAEGGPQDVNLDSPPVTETDGYGFTLHVNHDLGFANLVSISGYRRVDKLTVTDIDGGPLQHLAIRNNEENRQFSQELRLDSNGQGPLTWVLGLYYFDYNGGFRPTTLSTASPFGTLVLNNVTNTLTTKAYAAFAQGTYALTPATNITIGGRYSWEDRTATGSGFALPGAPPPVPVSYNPPKLSEKKPTWRLAIDHHFNDDVMAYASYNRGFKSGGFNAINLASDPFLAEKIDAYELGLKSEMFDRRVRLNVAGFYYKYSNLQVTVIDLISHQPVVTNAGSATIKGIEAQLTASIAKGLTLDAGVAYTDAKYDSYQGAQCVLFDPNATPAVAPESIVCDASGRRLLRTPKYVVTISPRYSFDIGNFTGDLAVSYYYGSRQDLVFTDSPLLSPKARNTLNASFELGLPGGNTSVTLWANNILDEKQLSFLATPPNIPMVSGHGLSSFYLPPRTYGAKLNFKF